MLDLLGSYAGVPVKPGRDVYLSGAAPLRGRAAAALRSAALVFAVSEALRPARL
jgi:hypothetical protein